MGVDMAFEKVTKGKPFDAPAIVWNGFIDAANTNQANQINQGTENARALNPSGVVLVKNQSGLTIPRFGVVVVNQALLSPASAAFKNDTPVFQALRYQYSSIWKVLGIMQEPLKNGRIGKALVCGITPAVVNIVNAGRYAVPDLDNPFVLKSAHEGAFKIAWQPSGSGEQYCMLAVGMGEFSAYNGMFKLALDGSTVNITNGSILDSYYAGFVLCNGVSVSVPTGSISSNIGYVCLKAEWKEGRYVVSYVLAGAVGGSTATTGYYALGYIRNRGGYMEVCQYHHATPYIRINNE